MLTADPPFSGGSHEAIRQLSNMRSGMSGDTAWATFYYELDTDGVLRHGLSTMVFRKVGNDWQIAVVQAASNMMQTHLMGDKVEQ